MAAARDHQLPWFWCWTNGRSTIRCAAVTLHTVRKRDFHVTYCVAWLCAQSTDRVVIVVDETFSKWELELTTDEVRGNRAAAKRFHGGTARYLLQTDIVEV